MRGALSCLPVFLAVPLVLDAGGAAAECAMPRPATFPMDASLPPRPVLYRFELAYGAPAALRIEGPHGPVPFTTRDVSSTDDIRVTEIRVDASADTGSITVSGGEYDVPRTYAIDARASLRAHVAPVVEEVAWRDDAWTCSHTSGLGVNARGTGVAAFRAVWPDGIEALVPASDSAFFWSQAMGGEIDPAALRAFLGHPSCVGNLIPTAKIGKLDVRLYARYADGTELEVELPREQAEPQPQPQRQESAPWRVVLMGVVGLAGLVSVSTVVVGRRRRRGFTMVP